MIGNQDDREEGPIRINRRNYLSLFVGARDDNVGLGWPERVKASRGDHAVMLSAAKHLDAQRDRPFAAAQGDTVRHLRLMRIG
jgi:hypothetical protein